MAGATISSLLVLHAVKNQDCGYCLLGQIRKETGCYAKACRGILFLPLFVNVIYIQFNGVLKRKQKDRPTLTPCEVPACKAQIYRPCLP